jgi:hypothetical protein
VAERAVRFLAAGFRSSVRSASKQEERAHASGADAKVRN